MMQRWICAAVWGGVLLGPTQSVVGDWQGTIDAGAMRLRVAFHVRTNGSELTATLDSLDQNAKGIPVEEVTYLGSKLVMKLAALGAVYEGTMNAAGNEIVGTFRQGQALLLTLRRQDRDGTMFGQ